jgi:hypothetical protein
VNKPPWGFPKAAFSRPRFGYHDSAHAMNTGCFRTGDCKAL